MPSNMPDIKKSLSRLTSKFPTWSSSDSEDSSVSQGRWNIDGLRVHRSKKTRLPDDAEEKNLSKNQEKKIQKAEGRQEKEKKREEEEKALEQRRAAREKEAAMVESPEMKSRYGILDMAQAHSEDWRRQWARDKRFKFKDLQDNEPGLSDGSEVVFRARISTVRRMGPKLAFMVFRQQAYTIQGVLAQEEGKISEYFADWALHLPDESVVWVKGTLVNPHKEITGTTIHHLEVSVQELHLVSRITDRLPFNIYDADVTVDEDNDEEGRNAVAARTRLVNRVLDLRTSPSQAAFRIKSGLCSIFRSHLDSLGFVEIQTPKLQGGATESGASVFQLDYFGRPAFLAQSPQLAKQMCVSADFERVYEVGPVFRAENSNTHRHLTEYIGLDIEMALEEHYHEALHVIDSVFKAMWKGIYERHRPEIELVKRRWPHEDLVWLDETPIIPFKEGINMLRESGWTDEDGEPPKEDEDLGTRDEIRLGELVKERYKTDYYILDKFPVSARPFYTMVDREDPSVTNSFDIFLRGQEILSGGQRIHDADELEARMDDLGMPNTGMEDYLEAFRWGAPPHAGGGIGLERVVMLLLEMKNIRHASLFPRDPKSLPTKTKENLRHPEASTLHPLVQAYDDVEPNFQEIKKLIANYGDATNTSYLEKRTMIWRDRVTGAAVGYVPQDSHAIILGNPLCEKLQYMQVISRFLLYLHSERRDLSPVWLLVGEEVEEILGGKLGWRTLSCIAESRTILANNRAQFEPSVQRKLRHAEREGVSIVSLPPVKPVAEDVQNEVSKRVREWLDTRKGEQVHLTQLNKQMIFQDQEHRRYFYAKTKDGQICALVVLAELAHEHGFQVKYSMDFPNAPNGTIEMITLHALREAKEAGAKQVTFGASATRDLTVGHNLTGVKIKTLKHTYKAIADPLKLTNKGEFREKLGAEEDPVYICYPRKGLSTKSIRAIMNFFEEPE